MQPKDAGKLDVAIEDAYMQHAPGGVFSALDLFFKAAQEAGYRREGDCVLCDTPEQVVELLDMWRFLRSERTPVAARMELLRTVCEMRGSGLTLREIAETIPPGGGSKQYIAQLLKRASSVCPREYAAAQLSLSEIDASRRRTASLRRKNAS